MPDQKTDFRISQKSARWASGLTLVETLVAILIIAILTTSSFAALTTLNTYAIINRNRVAALAIVQGAVEEFLSEPFTATLPSGSPLQIGTRTQENVPIITNPSTGQTALAGTLVSVVTDGSLDSFGNPIDGRENLRLLRGSFTLTYVYRGRTYTVTQSTMRANDQ